jgi:hypothetical protein
MTDRRDPSPHNELVRFWCDTYQARMGTRYPFQGGKDGATIKWLREMYSDDEIRGFMRGFFEIEDAFIEDAGHSMGVFRATLPKVIQFVRKQQQPKQAPKRLQGLAEWRHEKRAVNE